MNDLLDDIGETLAHLGRSWRRTPAGDRLAVDDLADAELVALNESLGAARRRFDAVHSRIASEIARRSRPEHGAEGLAKKNGYRTPVTLIAATTGTTVGEAAKLVSVGEATAPRRMFSGEDAPARHPFVAAALAAGEIGMPASSAIITMLDRIAMRVDRPTLDDAERTLIAQAHGLALDQLAKVITRAEAYLDPDGLQPHESEMRQMRSLRFFERDGMLCIDGKFDPVSGAPIRTAIEAVVTAEFRNEADQRGAGGASADTDGVDSGADAANLDGTAGPVSDRARGPLGDDSRARTVAQRQADALLQLAEHLLGCDSTDKPIDGPTVIVRMTLADLESGTGVATIDGVAQPISVSAARRMAASGGVIPEVLGGESEILDWGRRKRLFTRAQKLALAERDGGCVGCGLAPGMCKVHHLRWWARDLGPTDLDNGVLLCESCHHRVHDNGWEIRVEGTGVAARVWFIPPAHIDPRRTPRPGGNRRFSYAPAHAA